MSAVKRKATQDEMDLPLMATTLPHKSPKKPRWQQNPDDSPSSQVPGQTEVKAAAAPSIDGIATTKAPVHPMTWAAYGKPNKLDDKDFDGLFGEIGDGLVRSEVLIEAVREQKVSMFAAIASRIQQEVNPDNIDAFDRAMGSVRESYLERLREDLKARFDRLRSKDLEAHFKLTAMVGNIKRLPNCSTLCFVKQKSATFKENESSTTVLMTKFCGALKWTNLASSLKYIEWCKGSLISPHLFQQKASFTFAGKNVAVRHDPAQINYRIKTKHDYRFEVFDKKGKVLSSFPFETSYDIFAPATPATFYTYGSRLLLVTSFAKIPTNLVFNMLKKLDVNGQLPPTRPSVHFSACHFVLLDANFRLVKEFMTCASLQVRNFSIKVDFLNERGIMLSKVFHTCKPNGNIIFDSSVKRLVTFYDYNFKPVGGIQDLELPDSAKIASIVRIDQSNLIYYLSCETIDKKKPRMTFNVFDTSLCSAKSAGNIREASALFGLFLRSSLAKSYLLDSKNNLYAIEKSAYSTQGHAYYICCINLDTDEWQSIHQLTHGVTWQGCYLDENDQLTIVSKPHGIRMLTFSKFAI